jgi:hypothetical protein
MTSSSCFRAKRNARQQHCFLDAISRVFVALWGSVSWLDGIRDKLGRWPVAGFLADRPTRRGQRGIRVEPRWLLAVSDGRLLRDRAVGLAARLALCASWADRQLGRVSSPRIPGLVRIGGAACLRHLSSRVHQERRASLREPLPLAMDGRLGEACPPAERVRGLLAHALLARGHQAQVLNCPTSACSCSVTSLTRSPAERVTVAP